MHQDTTSTPHSQPHIHIGARGLLEGISIRRASWRRQIAIAFALMSIIPLLTFAYLVAEYDLTSIVTTENLTRVLLLNILVVTAGYGLLWRTARELSTLSDGVRRVAEGTLSWAHAAGDGNEIHQISDALASIVDTLKQDKVALSESTSRLEQEIALRSQEVNRANQSLRQTNIELSRALEEIRTTQSHLITQERLNALSQMASGIAHDFNNTLMPIVGLSHFLLSHPEIMDDRDELIDTLKDIRSAGDDAKKVVARLREFYRADTTGAPTRLNLSDIIEEAIQATQPKWQEEMRSHNTPVSLERRLGTTPPISGNRSLLKEVFINLILNATDALTQGGAIIISTETEGDRVLARVTDNGIGMNAESTRRCIEPFYTTKNDQGSGLGLSMCYGVIRRHNGELTVESELGKGTTILIRLPVASDQNATASAPAVAFAPNLRILVVDDDPRARKLIGRVLAAGHHQPVFASEGREGIDLFSSAPFDAVITDRAMPDMSGDAFARAIRNLSPHVPLVMVTGFGDLMKTRDQLPEGVDALVAKPVTEDELNAALTLAFSRHALPTPKRMP